MIICLIISRWVNWRSLIFFCAFSGTCFGAVNSNEQCDGLAIVSPPGPDFGTVYMGPQIISRQEKNPKRFEEKYPRVGYLPSGTVINLEEPKKGKTLHLKHCGFRYRDAIVGHIDRGHITKLDNAIRALKSSNPDWADLSTSEIAFISPANSDEDLTLYKSPDLSSVLAKLSRSDRSAILFPRSNLDEQSDVIEVRYAPDITTPVLEKAYVKKTDDRDYNLAGAFRIFTSLADSPRRSSETTGERLDFDKYLQLIKLPKDKILTFTEIMKKYGPYLGACGHTESAEVEVGAGFDLFVKVGASVKVAWEKPKDEAIQTARFGPFENSELVVAARAHCDDDDHPTFLMSAAMNYKGNSFVVIDDGLFAAIDGIGNVRSMKDYRS